MLSNTAHSIMVVTRSMLRAQNQTAISPQIKSKLSTSTILNSSYTFNKNSTDGKFVMKLDAKSQAFIEYEESEHVYTLHYTSVPASHQGKGIAKILAQKTFEHIILHNGKMKLTCDYLIKFSKENSRYKKYIV